MKKIKSNLTLIHLKMCLVSNNYHFFNKKSLFHQNLQHKNRINNRKIGIEYKVQMLLKTIKLML